MHLERVKSMTLIEEVSSVFETTFGESPAVTVRSPGCVNLMGGHADYSGGYVLAMNIEQSTVIALRARDDSQVVLHDSTTDETLEFDLSSFEHSAGKSGEAVKAIAWALGDAGNVLRGWEGVVGTDIASPVDMGAEVSLLLASLRAFAEVSGLAFEPADMASFAARAQSEWLNSQVNYPFALSVAMNQPGEALQVDALSGDAESVAFADSAALVLMLTSKPYDDADFRRLVNTRTEEFQIAASIYKVNHLRDLSMSRFEKDSEEIDDDVFKRARHFLTENGRTILTSEMLRSDALTTVGKLMNDSYTSLVNDYDLSDERVKTAIDCVMQQPNVFGARWAGVGGVVVALVRDFSADTAGKLAATCYQKATGEPIDVIASRPAGGVEVL